MQKIYFYDNGIMYHVVKCSDEVFVHAEIDNELVIGRGKSFKEAVDDAKKFLDNIKAFELSKEC